MFALGQFARRRRIPLLLAATSNHGRLVDPLATPIGTLTELLAASDLSANPGLALEAVLSEEDVNRRDVVLLTHPRNLAEADVLAAARTAGEHTRLFAVAVDGHGAVVFHELRRGGAVTIGQFRIDLDTPESPPRIDACAGWSGDIEPIGFPFRFGVAGEQGSLLFAFDHAGEWVLAAAHHGMLCACRTDGSASEMLPRPLVEGAILTDIDRVVGVSGGFVVIGAMKGRLIAVHYDFPKRKVKRYEFTVGKNLVAEGVEWRYSLRRHTLILRVGQQFWGVSLATGRRDEAVSEDLRWHPLAQPASRKNSPLPCLRWSAKRPINARVAGVIFP